MPNNPLDNFILENCLFGATNVRNSNKVKWAFSGCGIAFDGKGSWTFGSDFSRNLVICGDVNGSSSHSDNRKNNFLILGESPTTDICCNLW